MGVVRFLVLGVADVHGQTARGADRRGDDGGRGRSGGVDGRREDGGEHYCRADVSACVCLHSRPSRCLSACAARASRPLGSCRVVVRLPALSSEIDDAALSIAEVNRVCFTSVGPDSWTGVKLTLSNVAVPSAVPLWEHSKRPDGGRGGDGQGLGQHLGPGAAVGGEEAVNLPVAVQLQLHPHVGERRRCGRRCDPLKSYWTLTSPLGAVGDQQVGGAGGGRLLEHHPGLGVGARVRLRGDPGDDGAAPGAGWST